MIFEIESDDTLQVSLIAWMVLQIFMLCCIDIHWISAQGAEAFELSMRAEKVSCKRETWSGLSAGPVTGLLTGDVQGIKCIV